MSPSPKTTTPARGDRHLKVLLTRPRPDAETIGLQHIMLVEPLELEELAALCRPDATPVVIDLMLEEKPFAHFLDREQPDVVGLTGYITNVPDMIGHCREAKERLPGVATVVGGVHCEVCPDDLDDPAIDFRVVRNAVAVFPVLLEHIRGQGPLPPGVLRPGERADASLLPPYSFDWVRPDRTVTRHYRHRYFYIFHNHVALLKTSFGCPFRCSFCFCREVTGRHYHERAVEDVLDELESIEEREIYIVDDDFLVSEKRVRTFIAGLEKRKIDKRYLLYGRADFIARHPEAMAAFRDAGLRTVIVGFESFLEGELDQYDKGVDVETNVAAMEVLNELGLDCYATLILPPSWGREEFATTEQMLRRLRIKNVNLQPLTPLPGTGTDVPDDKLVIKRDDFPKWDLAHVTVRPEKLSVAEFYRELLALYMRTAYRPVYLASYLKYPVGQIWRMVVGTRRVQRQYLQKLAAEEQAERASAAGAR